MAAKLEQDLCISGCLLARQFTQPDAAFWQQLLKIINAAQAKLLGLGPFEEKGDKRQGVGWGKRVRGVVVVVGVVANKSVRHGWDRQAGSETPVWWLDHLEGGLYVQFVLFVSGITRVKRRDRSFHYSPPQENNHICVDIEIRGQITVQFVLHLTTGKIHWMTPFSKMSPLYCPNRSDGGYTEDETDFVEVFVGRKLTEVASFLEVPQCFGMSGSLETKCQRLKILWERRETSPTMELERKKERKTKECSKVQIVSTKINACLGIYNFRSSRAHIWSFVAVIRTVKC